MEIPSKSNATSTVLPPTAADFERARELLAFEYDHDLVDGPFPSYAQLARSGMGALTRCSIRAVAQGIALGRQLAKEDLAATGDCYHRAEPGEPKFTLIGRDPFAGGLIRLWAIMRAKENEAAAIIAEALAQADNMDNFARSKGRMPADFDGLLMQASEGLEQHPDEYKHPCSCDSCLSHAD